MALDVYKGTTSGTVQSGRTAKAGVIERIIVSNLGGGVISVNVRVVGGEAAMHLLPPYKQLWAGEMYKDEGILLREREMVEVTAIGGEVDYYFSIKQNS